MIYDSVYRPWSPLAARLAPGLADPNSFTFAKGLAIILVCIFLYVVFWAYDFAIRYREETLKESVSDEIKEKYASFYSLYAGDPDLEFEDLFGGRELHGKIHKMFFVYNSIQYTASVAAVSVFAWMALGPRQAFCVFVGTVCILDIRRVWRPFGGTPG